MDAWEEFHGSDGIPLDGVCRPPPLGLPALAAFLGFYLLTLLGNCAMILLIRQDRRLHTPMYFFLGHLARGRPLLVHRRPPGAGGPAGRRRRPSPGRAAPPSSSLFTFFASMDCYLLAIMAYDRCVAVCRPLLYVAIVTEKARWVLVAGRTRRAFSSALIRTVTAFTPLLREQPDRLLFSVTSRLC